MCAEITRPRYSAGSLLLRSSSRPTRAALSYLMSGSGRNATVDLLTVQRTPIVSSDRGATARYANIFSVCVMDIAALLVAWLMASPAILGSFEKVRKKRRVCLPSSLGQSCYFQLIRKGATEKGTKKSC